MPVVPWSIPRSMGGERSEAAAGPIGLGNRALDGGGEGWWNVHSGVPFPVLPGVPMRKTIVFAATALSA